jgi:hypothetical protein
MWSSDTALSRAAESVRLALEDYVIAYAQKNVPPGLELIAQG